MSDEENRELWKGERGMTATLRCKVGESAEECAERHRKAGWEVPSGVKLGEDAEGPILVR